MHFSHTILTVPIALLIIGIIQAEPVIFIKNNSNRAVHIQPMGKGKQPLMQAQFVKAQGEYKEENVDANDVKGVDIKYCQKGVSCATPDDIRTNGTVMRFEFHDPSATKYYLKLDIDKNDTISLKQQEGKLGRTSNLKWSLAGNIIQDAISRPLLIPAAPTNMPPALPKPKASDFANPSVAKATSNKPDRPTIAAPTEDEDMAITLMPETLEQKTIIPTPITQHSPKSKYKAELERILSQENFYISTLEKMIADNAIDENSLKDSVFQQFMNEPIKELMKQKPEFNATESELYRQHGQNYSKAGRLRYKASALVKQ